MALEKALRTDCQSQVKPFPLLIVIPKYLAFFTQGRLIPSTEISLQGDRYLIPILRHIDFPALICKSKHFKDNTVKSKRVCRSLTEILNKIRSSAYKKLLKQHLLIKQPHLIFSKFVSTISMYAEKGRGDKIPPCLTPASKETGSDSTLFHFIRAVLLLYL